jgi:hypothetical protein
MKKLISLALLLTLLSNVTFAEKPKQPRYKLGRKLNKVAIVAVGTAFLINIIRVIKIAK